MLLSSLARLMKHRAWWLHVFPHIAKIMPLPTLRCNTMSVQGGAVSCVSTASRASVRRPVLQVEKSDYDLETAMGLYGFTDFELMWERTMDTKCESPMLPCRRLSSSLRHSICTERVNLACLQP